MVFHVIAYHGTENVHVPSVQKFLRRNDNDLPGGIDAAFRMENLSAINALRHFGHSCEGVVPTGGYTTLSNLLTLVNTT